MFSLFLNLNIVFPIILLKKCTKKEVLKPKRLLISL